MEYIMGVNLEKSGCGAVLYNRRLERVAAGYSGFSGGEGGEVDAGLWWPAFCAAVAQCLGESGVAAGQVACVSIAALVAVLPVDQEGNPLHPALLKVADLRGGTAASKILWFRDNRPQVYGKTHCFLSANGYLVHKLTGESCLDRPQAEISRLFDLGRQAWSEEVLEGLGLHGDKLSPVRECSFVAGRVTEAAATACGLGAGTAVLAGAPHWAAAALGTGGIRPGDVCLVGNRDVAVCAVADTPVHSDALLLIPHAVPGRYIRYSTVEYCAGGLEWFEEVLGGVTPRQADDLALQAPPGNQGLLFLPYMVGQRSPLYSGNATGVVFGLTPDHQRSHLARMFMEGAAHALRYLVGILREEGVDPPELRLTGKMADSAVWTQIISDVLELPVKVPTEPDTAVFGAAVIAAVAMGWYASYEEATDRLGYSAHYRPNIAHRDVYGRASALYGRLFDTIMPVCDDAKGIL